jgi:hypothetical protein
MCNPAAAAAAPACALPVGHGMSGASPCTNAAAAGMSAPVTAAGCVGGGAAPEELDTTESWAIPPAALIFDTAHELDFSTLRQHAEHQEEEE